MKLIGLIAMTSVAAVSLSATVSAKDFWIKAQGTDCQVWSDEAPEAKDVVSWTGSCKDGKASGEGVLTWTEGGQPAGKYEGFMAAGKLNGPGKLHLVEKTGTLEVDAIFKDGDVDGAGRFKDAAGDVYEGEVKDGKPYGFGFRKTGDEEYVGNFEDGLRHGIGMAIGPETAYLGEFDKDVANGSGMLEDDAGGRYHGQFKDNKPHGFGTYVTSDGTVYQGRFVNGNADGAMFVTPKGSSKSIVETWKNGKQVK